MKFFRTLLFVYAAAAVLAQTPSPKPAAPASGATPPQPSVTLTTEGATAAASPSVAPDKVVLTVGDLKITSAQFDEIIDSLVPENFRQAAHGPGRKQMADNLVRMIVLSQEAQKRKLDQTPAYKTQLQFQTMNLLANLAIQQINKTTTVSDADLHKYYDEHQADYEQAHARHILIRTQGSPLPVKPGQKDLTEAEALAKAQEIRKKIAAGVDFAAVATQESDDTQSGPNGGELGTFHHGQMVPTFEQAAFALKPGELSEPVKTQFGYHLIKLESKETKSFDEVRPEISKKLQPAETQKAVEALRNSTPVVFDPDYFPTTATPAAK
ncbi:MAG TPA: peptidylprolyl isomerase [Bryobacteraceae bacterium]